MTSFSNIIKHTQLLLCLCPAILCADTDKTLTTDMLVWTDTPSVESAPLHESETTTASSILPEITLTPEEQVFVDSTVHYLRDFNVKVFAGVDSFRGNPDGVFGDNNGINFGVTGSMPLPNFPYVDGAGVQLGASYGAYNFAGKSSYHRHSNDTTSQGFFTFGFFKQHRSDSNWAAGFTYDVMLSDNFSAFSHSLWLSQWRAKCSYFLSLADEVGIQASIHGQRYKRVDNYSACRFNLALRAISQATIFWKHNFEAGMQTTVWAGTPICSRLDRRHSHRPGKLIIGGEFSVPFYTNWEIIARAQYMQPGTKRRHTGAFEYGNNIAVAVQYNFGGTDAPSTTSTAPYMSMANNSNFLVDARAHTHVRR